MILMSSIYASTGKFRTSLNATKHGAYSKNALTPDENDAYLAKLERMYVAHYRPPTELDLYDVRKLALLDWRLQRYGRLEAELLTLHGYEREHERGKEGFEYGALAGAWRMTARRPEPSKLLAKLRVGCNVSFSP
jgi:hypothetical protein